ncbi:MAG: aromatic ring-hydroxylating dioxygenase subunit alpha [Gammaproteobacteria bacterium]|nr:aromatic ring-hydroxylating dioxygenase subunit alpha [Gammaproteobacteria bacterium]
MFINNWYAACVAADLGTAPMRVRILDCDFVLFRDASGRAHCLSDTCCHRGASLAAGSVQAGRIRCPQHGWEYDASGRCALIPQGSRDGAHPPKRARVPAYPVEERYGLVFAFLGDLGPDERPVMPDLLPEYATGEWYCDLIRRRKDIHYLRMAENYNDPCHVHYVHEFGRWLPKGVTIETEVLTPTYVRAFHAAWDAKGRWGREQGLMMEYSVIGLLSRNTNLQPGYPRTIVLASVTPIDACNTQIFMLLLMPKADATEAQHRALVTMTEKQVMDEDYAVLKTTRPVLAAEPAEELLVESDLTLAQVRKMTLEFAASQGEIDQEAWAPVRQSHIRVVPCPEHRTDPKNWVHKLLPLRPRRSSAVAAAAAG